MAFAVPTSTRSAAPAPLLALAAVLACGDDGPMAPPGRDGAAAHGPARRDERDRSPEARAHEAGAAILQDTTPVEQLQLVLDGFHGVKREVVRPPDAQRQQRAFYYCDRRSADFYQCAVFDGDDVGAHLVGVEYVVSAALYATLPAVERQYWHPHAGEIDSGLLVAPGLPPALAEPLLQDLRATYGKTWLLWDSVDDALPFGEPALGWTIPASKISPRTRAALLARPRGR
jgi:predicted small lipoprotein YifL